MIKKIGESKLAESRHWSIDDALTRLTKMREQKEIKKIIILTVDADDVHNYIVAGTASKLETLGILGMHLSTQSNEAYEPSE